jgi:acyl-CoA synthetase
MCLIDEEESFPQNVFRSSGDAVQTENGMLYIVGRLDDQIKRHGKRLNLVEI